VTLSRAFQRALAAWCAGSALLAVARPSVGDPEFTDAEVLGAPPDATVELAATRITAYDQTGFGYQSQEGPIEGPGSETLHVLQAQGELDVRQGDSLEHHVWIPVDVVTSASANASDRYYATPDIISTASAQNIAKEFAYELTARADRDTTWTGGVSFHHEENFLSWALSLELQLSLADDNATLSLAATQVLDWFDVFALGGVRAGRASRSSTNLNVALSQLLSPSTLVFASYGITLQRGELSNTWNTVPTVDGERIREILPLTRNRQALAAGLTQWLPWDGALTLRYRYYRDDWSVRAHSFEALLRQSITPVLWIGARYRGHRQNAVAFFTTRAPVDATLATADSDLGAFTAWTLGGEAGLSLPTRRFGELFLSAGFDWYERSDALMVRVLTWASGFRF